MKTLDTFYDLLLPQLPGISTPMLDLHLVQVARDFCVRSRAWRGDFDPLDTVAAQATYDLGPSESQSEVVAVHKLTVNGVLLFDDAWTPDDWHRYTTSCTNLEPKYQRTDPPFSMADDASTITLIDPEIPDCSTTGGLALSGSMRPKHGATQLPDMLYLTHLETLRAGVFARLKSMTGKPWAAADAGYYMQQYESGLQFAAAFAQRGNVRAPLRVKKWG